MIVLPKPREQRQKEYAEFLRSDFWQDLRRQALIKFGHKCAKCPSRSRLEPHHLFYRSDWYATELGDLLLLCRKCHRKEHGLFQKAHSLKVRKNQNKSSIGRRRKFAHIQREKKYRLGWSF